MDAALLASIVPDPIAWLIGILLIVLLPIGAGMGVGWLLSQVGRLRRRASAPTPPAAPPPSPRPPSPARRPGGRK